MMSLSPWDYEDLWLYKLCLKVEIVAKRKGWIDMQICLLNIYSMNYTN
jgi:hypothetical protein